MQKTAEFVSLGHPDKTADYISSYILDRMMEQDNNVRYAVEVMIKGNTVVLGGEICGNVSLDNVAEYVCKALHDIGYTKRYSKIWGDDAINTDKLEVLNFVGCQSPEILQGVKSGGWGDQGVFAGYACRMDTGTVRLHVVLHLGMRVYLAGHCGGCMGGKKNRNDLNDYI